MRIISKRWKTAFVAGAALISTIVVTAVVLLQRANEPQAGDPASSAEQRLLRFDDFNFHFDAPETPWARIDPKRVNPDATLGFTSKQPEMAFVLLADAPGIERSADLETLKDIAVTNFRGLWDKVKVRGARAESLGGVAGQRLTIDAVGPQGRMTYVMWLGMHGGYTYQLQLFSPAVDAESLSDAADDIFPRFSLADPARVVHAAATIEDFQSPRHGYVWRLADTNWQPWDNLAEVLPDAECGAMIGNYARAAVIPVSFLGRQPRLEAVTTALVARLGIAFSPSQVRNIHSVPGLAGHRFEMTRDVAGRSYSYRFQVVQNAGHGYLVAAWADAASPPGTFERLDDLLDRFRLQPSRTPAAAQAAELTLEQKQTHAQVFNDLGRYHFNARLFGESADYFRQAFELLENDPVLLDNTINAHVELNQLSEARGYLEKHLRRFPEHHELLARYAFVQAGLGDADAAIKTYGELFAARYRGDEAFAKYIELLTERNREDEAIAQVTQYRERGTSAIARRLEAMLYSRKGDHARSIAVLKELQQAGPFDVEVAYELADACLAGGQLHEGLAVCRDLLDRRYDTPYTYMLKGRLEVGLKWYAAAKTSFEAALRKDPANKTTLAHLDQVSGMLGEGNNSAIKDPITPVPIPSELAELPPASGAEPYRQQYGACYLQRLTAIAFEAGTEVKTTTRQVIRLFDASGVTRFSTFQIEFDPLAEQLYVNTLRVTDGEGKEVAFGKPSDYYVIDDTANDGASGRKLLGVPVPGLQPGYTIEMVFTRRDLVSSDRFPFTEHYFTADVPILRDSVFVRAHAGAVLSRSSAGLSPNAIEGGQVWTVEKPPVYHYEPMQAAVETFVPYVLLGSPAQNWSELAGAYLKSIADRLEIEPSTRTLAEQTVSAASNDDDKSQALARLVRDQLTYKAIEFGRRARIPNKASTVLANRYGDCKDHSLLLAQLLQASGIEAHLALVRTDGAVDDALPSLDQFDHVIVFVPKLGEGRFFDCTDKDSPFDRTPPRGLATRPAFVLDPAGPRFIAIPAYPADGNRIESERALSLVDQTDVSIEETLRLEGHLAATLRGLLKEIQPANRARVLQTQLSASAGGPLQIQKVEIENFEDPSAPLVLRIQGQVKGRFHVVGDSLVGQVPAIWERFFFKADRVEKRQTPFVARYPLRVKSTITIQTPAGFTFGDMGALNKQEHSQFAEWRVTAEGKDQSVRVVFEASRAAGQYPAEQYAAYCDSIDQTMAALAQNVVLKRVEK